MKSTTEILKLLILNPLPESLQEEEECLEGRSPEYDRDAILAIRSELRNILALVGDSDDETQLRKLVLPVLKELAKWIFDTGALRPNPHFAVVVKGVSLSTTTICFPYAWADPWIPQPWVIEELMASILKMSDERGLYPDQLGDCFIANANIVWLWYSAKHSRNLRPESFYEHDWWPDLFESAIESDEYILNRIREGVEAGKDINAHDEYFGTFLVWAVSKNRIRITQELLKLGATLRSQDCSDCIFDTPFHDAVEWDHIEVLELLFRFKETELAQSCNEFGLTPMAMAARGGNLTILKLLLENGCNPDERCEDQIGCPPIKIAAEEGHVEIVEYLLKSGAKAWTPGWMMRTAYCVAVDRNDKTGARIIELIEKYDPMSDDRGYNLPGF